ncbi:preprotein translocase subunit SecD [Candidatus Woesearchaeota archaeon]|nr:preprotein translocase subunit SecD [Candidatus Woesearchaeota archaeon]
MKLGKVLKKWRVIVLTLFLIFSLLAISPRFDTNGVAIKSIEQNSTASDAGIQNPLPNTPPTKLERILYVNNKPINSIQDYGNIISDFKENDVVRIRTDKREYAILLKEQSLGINVDKVASSNVRRGLDLEGGTRVLLQPTSKINDNEREDLISVMENRLNTYGLTDIKVKKADDLLGNRYILVEIAGVTKQEVKELIGSQGKFEAKIGNDVVFEGGKKDITFVCRNDGTCSGIRQCTPASNGYICQFDFEIALSADAAKKHAEITKNLDINLSDSGNSYLSKPLDLYIDSILVDSLQISSNLKGQEVTRVTISGPGIGSTQEEAQQNALKQMNKLQTILITGSFPTKLNIVKVDSISPLLGSAFARSALLLGLIAIFLVALIIYVRYRSLKISIPMVITMLSELIILLGFAALFRYNLDLAAIAGILAAIGTGVDDQIVIADEVLTKEAGVSYKWKQKIKRAFFIIMAAWTVGVASMIPLFWAGAGLLTGFALSTIVGISIGVFITRPAYAAAIEVLHED